MKFGKARDANQKSITDELTKRGVEVVDLSAAGNVPDLLCFYRGFTGWIEVKIPGSRAAYTRRQLEWIAGTRWPVLIATNAVDAFEFMQTGEGLSQKQKDNLAGFLRTTEHKQFHPAAIQTALRGEMIQQ